MYQGDFEDLQGQFVHLFVGVTKDFKKDKSVTVKKLKRVLFYYPDLKVSLVNADSISDIMLVLQNHSTFICCSRLKYVAEKFKISSVAEKIEIYFQYLKEFCSRKLTEHIYLKPFITAKSMEFAPSTTLTFKLEWNPDDKTLSDIQGVLRLMFHEHSIYVHIVVVRGGSVWVICCAPQYLMVELVRLAQRNRELLVESSVTYLRVGDTIVVNTSDQNEVRICYHRNCHFDHFHHQISDLVFQLNIALQLKGEHLLCQLRQVDVDIFDTEYLEQALGRLKREDVNCLIEVYKQEKDQFMENTTVFDFQQSVLSTAELTVEGKESIEITVSKKWVRAMTLKDVQTLARMAFDDNHTSFSSFNVVPRSILITWFFPKRLTAKLQQLAMTNAFVFQQQDVRDVTVAGMVCIQATQLQ